MYGVVGVVDGDDVGIRGIYYKIVKKSFMQVRKNRPDPKAASELK